MRFIVKDKLYDTDKAELLCIFSKQWKSETILETLYPYRDTDLYKTAKGAYFITSTADNGKNYIEVVEEITAKYYLMFNDYDKYCEMFGPLEEA